MRLVRFSLRTVRLAGILFLAILSLTALAIAADKLIDARQTDLIEQLRTDYADGPEILVEKLRLAQMELTIITPPGMDHPLHQPYGMMSFDPKGFPEEFLKGLVFDLVTGCPIYTITVQEDPKTGEIHFYNGEDVHFFTLQPIEDYDFRWLVSLLRPETYDARFSVEYRADIEYWLDPARIEIELQLIPAEYIEIYAAKTFPSLGDKVQSLGGKIRGGGIMLMRLPAADSNIVIQAITAVTNGMKLEIGYPATFTNRLEIFACTDLVAFSWSLSATNLSTTGTNTIWWTDTATNLMIRFYAAGNADLDNDTDGLTDAREKYLYHSSPTNLDSDNDGLVDGFSGVVATNTYPGGAHTNGGPYVEGELSWFTDANRVDTDDDGMGDGWEVANGHNPTNWNDPPNVRGTVTYTGRQTGTVWIVAVTNSASWYTNALAILAAPGAYRIPHLEATNYWIKAWMDSNASGTTNATEARGNYTNSAMVITNRVLDIDFTLADPDDNTNSLPDWWEVKYSGSTTNWSGSGDPDGDHYTNLEEYQADTDPTNTLSHPWNLSGTVSYTGPQTGVLHIIACTSSNGWVAAQYTTNAVPGAFTITHLPPDANYWIKAWRDSNGNGSNNDWEAFGEGDGNPVYLDSEYTGVNVVLTDPDNDGDSISDWWELKYGLNPAYGGEDGASAWWQLDAVTGTNVLDSTANANHGTLGGTTGAVWSLGIIGNGLIFNGTNAFVEVPDSASLDPNFVSLGLWVKPGRTYTNGTAALLSKKPAAATGYELTYTNGGLAFTICSAGAKTLRWPCALTAAVPVHVAATYGGSWQRLYINGTLAAQSNYNWGTDYGYISQNTNALRLGASADPAPTNFFAGLLDDVRIYSGEWTTNQIKGIYELGADPDSDGLGNFDEYHAGTCPTNSDTDGDGMLDGWEATFGLTPLSATDATEDKDGDGYLNIYESKRGSDPTSLNSVPSPSHVVTNGVGTIQGMINIVTQDYAVVQVKAGTYTGTGNRDIDFGGKKLMLVGENGAPNTVIDCEYVGRGLYFHSGETVLSTVKDLTIRNGQAARGAGILCSGGSPWINGCHILSNRPPQVDGTYAGSGICVDSGTARVTSCTVSGNGSGAYATDFGGGIALYDSVVISNTIVQGNDAFYGGGIYFGGVAGKTGCVSQCAVTTNRAIFGGGLWATNRLEISGGVVSSNWAASGGGGIWCAGDTKMDGVIICGNQVDQDGGGIASSIGAAGKMPILLGVLVASNTAGGTGGGLFHYPGGETPLILSNCTVVGNTAPSIGGVSALYGGLIISGGTVAENSASDVGGVFVFCPDKGPVELTGVKISENRQTGEGSCGGLSIFKGTNDMDVVLRGLLISNNCTTVSNGDGGFYLFSSASVTMEDCEVVGNTGLASSAGGGSIWISTTHTATVARCRFMQNVGQRAGGLDVESQYGHVWVKECVFSENTSLDSFGGLVACSLDYPSLIESTAFFNNLSKTNGAAGFCNKGVVQNCTIAGNVCSEPSGVGGMADWGVASELLIRNSVVWGNTGAQIDYGSRASYSCIEGGYTNNGSSNIITNNPGLLGGYRLLGPTSPCLRAGSPTGLPATDINGDPWLTPATPDIGCDGFASIDNDFDGMNDEWETFFFGSLANNATADNDNDNLSDLDEYENGVDPLTSDTDGDFMPDGWEVARGLDPVNPGDTGGDWNGDGLSNEDEFSREALAVRVSVTDPYNDDDVWSVLLNGHVVASGGAGSPGSGVAYIPFDTAALFTIQLVADDGATNNPDEFVVSFESVDSSGELPWLPDATNSSTQGTLSYPYDTSGIQWTFTVPRDGKRLETNPDRNTARTIDPINTISGAITLDETDLAVACPGFGLVFERSYNSKASNGVMGRGWSHSFEWSLATVTNGAYQNRMGNFKVLRTGDGQSFWFFATNGLFLSPPDVNLALTLTNGEYRVSWPGGTSAAFDTNGVVQRLTDGFGTGLAFAHAGGLLTQVQHSNGKALTLTYTGDLLTRVDSPSANLYVTFGYSAGGLLTNAVRVADGVAFTERYDYESVCHVLTQKVNAAGDVFAYGVGYVTNSPAWNGQPAVVTARGSSMSLNPATAGWYSHALSYTNPGGFATRVSYDRGDTIQVHEYAYDPVKMWVDAITGPGTPGTAVWSNTWTRFQHDAAGNVTNAAVADGGSGQSLASIAFYDGAHNVLSNGVSYLGNAVQNWSSYAWDTNALVGASGTAGLLLSLTDPAGHKTAFEYTNGLVNLVRECTNGISGFETRFFYSTNGLLAAVTNANNHGLAYEYDAAGYVSRMVPALGPDSRFVRNDLGQVTAVILPGEAGCRTNALTVNALGQVTAVTHPGGLTESFAFDLLGNLTNMVDTAGRTNMLTWLPTGKPASVSRWLDGPNPTNVMIGFAYDKQFNTLRITDPMGRPVESYTLDAQDRPVTVTNLEGQVMTVNWGVSDHVTKITRFDGTVVTNLYGTDGRLTEVRMMGTAAMSGVTNKFSFYADGSLKTASNAVGVISNSFDGANRLAFTTGAVPKSGVSYGYYPAGQVSNVVSAAGTVIYTLDAADRLVGMFAPEGNYGFAYATNGLMGAMSYPTGVTLSNRFDVLDRATSLVWRTSGSSAIRSFACRFDAAGMVTNVAREDGGRADYTYDSLDRLTSERQYTAGGGLSNSASWAYDLAGNRTMAVTNGVTNLYSYAEGNALTNFGAGTLVQYDLAGNTTNLQYSASRKLGLQWNAAYELTEVRTNGTLLESYRYDAMGRRANIIVAGITNTLIYDGPNLIAEYSNGTLIRSYTHGPGVDNIVGLKVWYPATNQFYYLKDHLGSVHALVSTNGSVVEQYRYTAWGETTVLSSNGTVLAASAYGNRFTWQGREISWQTGLLHFRSRYYAPTLGRWLSKDRIGISGGQNLYVAFNNVPTVYVDPFGNCPEKSRWVDWLQGVLDVGGTFEPTPFCDIANALISAGRGNWGDAGLTICGVVPYVGDAAKAGKYGIKGAKALGRTGKQAKLRKLAEDPLASSADRGWINNEMRHIETGNRETIRLPGNSRNSPQGGKVLAHKRGKRAADGNSYEHSNLQDTDLHALEHKYEGY